jgi:hypothetical protein
MRIFVGTDSFKNFTNSPYRVNQFELFVVFLLRGPECSGCQETFQYCVTLSILGVRRASNTV